MNERPTSVTVFAIINLILAGIGVLGLIWTLINRLGLIALPGAEDNPAYKLMQDNTGYRLLTDLLAGLGTVATILIISASIGMFALRPWSRLATIGWGIYTIVVSVLMGVVNHLLIVQPLLEQYSSGPQYTAVWISTMIGYIIAILFIGYYLLMIFILTRPAVIEAFGPETLDDYDVKTPTPAEPGDIEL